MAYVPRLNKPEENNVNKEELEININIFTIAKYVGIGIAAIFLIVTLFKSIYTVKSGFSGIELTFGRATAVVGDGLHFKVPYITTVQMVDVRIQKADAQCMAGSKDMQRITTTVALNYVLDKTKLLQIYTKTGLDVESNIIDPRILEIVKAVTAKYSAEELVTKREVVKADITELLKVEHSKYDIMITEVQITDFKFSEKFNASIEAKQEAEQSALKAKNDLDRIKVEAQQQIETAKAQAEAIRIQADAVRAQGGKEYVQLKAIEKWNGEMPTYMGGNSPMPFIDVAK